MSTTTLNGKVNRGWTAILYQHKLLEDIEQNGFARITSTELNTKWPAVDARIMAKFDTLEKRPAIFQKLGLSIWPEGNGKYVVVQSEDPYIKIDQKKLKNIPVRYLNARDVGFTLDTISFDDITTESQALAVLHYSRIMHAIHSAHTQRLALTDGGRARMQNNSLMVTFNTPKGRLTIPCHGVQMEPDAIHESDFLVTATESKLIRSKKAMDSITSLHARQIVFPHAQLQGILGNKNSNKRLESGILYACKEGKNKPWQFTWLPVDVNLGTNTQFQVAWHRAVRYELLESPEEKVNTQYGNKARTNLDLVETGRPESKSPFPQFDRFNVLEHIAYDMGNQALQEILPDLPTKTLKLWRRGCGFELSKKQEQDVKSQDLQDLVAKFAYKTEWGPRNITYLVNALSWLGLVKSYDPSTQEIKPSTLCLMLASVDPDVRVQRFWNLMMSSPILHAIAHNLPITEDMRKAEGLENDATFKRRIQTAKAWIDDMKSRMAATPDVAYVL